MKFKWKVNDELSDGLFGYFVNRVQVGHLSHDGKL